ncbi:MAG: hypothetical protein MPF33_09625 [Candidatus Aramenus sp.]|nr:hypothetical protein [Candidatus Aramenus sp.]
MEDVKDILVKILKKEDPNFVEESLDVKYVQNFNDERYDAFGEFQGTHGVYEFAISFDRKGNVKRNHINLIRPSKLDRELHDKLK